MELIDSVLKDFDRSFDVILEHEGAGQQIVGLYRVSPDSLAQLIHLADHFIEVRLHTTFVHLKRAQGHTQLDDVTRLGRLFFLSKHQKLSLTWIQVCESTVRQLSSSTLFKMRSVFSARSGRLICM